MKSDDELRELNEWVSYRVNVTSKGITSSLDGERKVEHFMCIVSFPSTDQHRETIDNYLKWYLEIDTDTDDMHINSLFFDSTWCARAIAVFYFREKNKPHLEADCEPGNIIVKLPTTEPDKRTENMAIWVNTVESSVEETEFKVAIYLRDIIRGSGKISVESARELIRSEFGELQGLDSDVMHAFAKLGGKSTKKYLRL